MNYYNNQMYQPNYAQPIYNAYQRQLLQKPIQSPFQNVLFLNDTEIKGRIVDPGTSDLLIDRDNHLAYVKSADQMGFSNTKAYRLEEKIPTESVNGENKGITTQNIDMSSLVQAKDFEETIKKLQEKIENLESKIKEKTNE